jgi:hypothetical protein
VLANYRFYWATTRKCREVKFAHPAGTQAPPYIDAGVDPTTVMMWSGQMSAVFTTSKCYK